LCATVEGTGARVAGRRRDEDACAAALKKAYSTASTTVSVAPEIE
jgi:hypothetical protein